ncbi:hypothetical protein AAG747_20365 [Rapidithrix thailandica]|uniref:Uncharacterized protein n=1 Tax=Rapidithrix thailandica TaxID=413964 RepID=A0AAW9S546_9BACT
MQRKRVSFILLSFALAFLLGHALVPHCHSTREDIAISTQKELDFTQLLKSIFSLNLGHDHLDNYTSNTQKDAVDIDKLCIGHSFEPSTLAGRLLTLDAVAFISPCYVRVNRFPVSQYLNASLLYRGPPYLV